MKDRLSLVVDNGTGPKPPALRRNAEVRGDDEFDPKAKAERFWAVVYEVLLLPFVTFAKLCGLFVDTGRNILLFAIKLALGSLGLAFLAAMAYGFVRVALYPLFH